MAQIRISMIIDSRRLDELIKLMGPEDAVSVSVLEINRVPEPEPRPTKTAMRQRYRRAVMPRPNQTTRAFILSFAAKNGAFSVAKDLIPAGLEAHHQKLTLYSTCARLRKNGVLKRNGAGSYELVGEDTLTSEQ